LGDALPMEGSLLVEGPGADMGGTDVGGTHIRGAHVGSEDVGGDALPIEIALWVEGADIGRADGVGALLV